MNGEAASSRLAVSTTSGRLAVTSERPRVQIPMCSPSRWSWMRAPSYLYSSAEVPPWAARTSSKSSAIWASMGRSGTPGRAVAEASAAAPPRAASAATWERSPSISAARRAVSSGAAKARAIASSTSPSDTPVRISPATIRCNVSRSSVEARATRPRSSSSRTRRAPAPPASATAANAAATSSSERDGPQLARRVFLTSPQPPPYFRSMRRRVLYDATSRAAAAAAELLRHAFDVAPLSASTDPAAAAPAVVLVGTDVADGRWGAAPLRILALVDADATGPWPAHWYGLLPAGVGGPILARAVENAFDDLDRAAAMTRLDRELSELNAIGIRLSAERNPR